MTKILALIFLVASANSYANSNWIYLTSTVDNDEFFIEPNSIQKDGDSVTFWTKRNFADRTEFGDLSEKIQRTINCRRREGILRSIQTYDDINNSGKLTASFKSHDSWRRIVPDSAEWLMMSFVCKYKTSKQ